MESTIYRAATLLFRKEEPVQPYLLEGIRHQGPRLVLGAGGPEFHSAVVGTQGSPATITLSGARESGHFCWVRISGKGDITPLYDPPQEVISPGTVVAGFTGCLPGCDFIEYPEFTGRSFGSSAGEDGDSAACGFPEWLSLFLPGQHTIFTFGSVSDEERWESWQLSEEGSGIVLRKIFQGRPRRFRSSPASGLSWPPEENDPGWLR